MIVPESDQVPPSAKPPTSDHRGPTVWEVVGIGLGVAVVGVTVALPGTRTGVFIIALGLAWCLAFLVARVINWARRTGRRAGYLFGVIVSAIVVLMIVGGLYLGPLSGGNQAVATPTPSPIVEKPILSSPGNGIGMPQKTDVTLIWNPSKDAVQYEVEVWGGPYAKMTSCIWQDATICHIGQMWPGQMSWHVKARNDKGQASEWSDTWSFQIGILGYVELVDDLPLTTPAGNWPPNKGDRLIAHIHISNGGDQPLQIEHIGVKGRRNGIENWDIGFWSITLNGHDSWSFDPNNERPLESGEYSFQLTYSSDGPTWVLLGSDYTFTIP